MVKTGTAAEQHRNAPERPVEDVITLPWAPRTDGRTALLVSERQTVFDHKAKAVAAAVEVVERGPMPLDWSHDLVHCRLLHLAALLNRLPSPKRPAEYRCWLGEQQPQEAGPMRRSLYPEETFRMDWTWQRVSLWSEMDRLIIKGKMTGKDVRMISKATFELAARQGGFGMSKSSVHRHYRAICETMAAEWIEAREPVDEATREVWLGLASRKQ